MWNKIKSMLGLGDDPELAAAKARMTVDHQDPRKRFVFGVLAMSYQADPAYLVEHSRMALRDWYAIQSTADLVQSLQRYLAGTEATPAYDAFRAAFMARAGLPAGLLSEGDSWAWALQAARKVQQSYPTWNDYAMGYLQGHLTYRQSEGDDVPTLDQHRRNIVQRIRERSKGIWSQTPFQTAL